MSGWFVNVDTTSSLSSSSLSPSCPPTPSIDPSPTHSVIHSSTSRLQSHPIPFSSPSFFHPSNNHLNSILSSFQSPKIHFISLYQFPHQHHSLSLSVLSSQEFPSSASMKLYTHTRVFSLSNDRISAEEKAREYQIFTVNTYQMIHMLGLNV